MTQADPSDSNGRRLSMVAEEQWRPRSAAAGPPPVAFDRQPPQDLPAEQSVLGGMLLSKDAIADVFEVLSAKDFYKPAHVHVFEVILDLYSRGEPADAITVSAELEKRTLLPRVGGAVYLHHLAAMVPTAANAGYYAQIVAEKAVLRRLVEAGTRIVQLGYGGADSANGAGGSTVAEIDEIVDRAQQEIYDVTEKRMSEDYVVLEELLQPTMDEIDEIANRGGLSIGVPTGFTDLDALTNGLHPGQMVIIAARPGVGKALALDTPLPTPTGWTTMADVRVGDLLIGADGHPVTIVATTDVMAGRPCYEVEFSDGAVIVADAEHQWLTTDRRDRPRPGGAGGIVCTTTELAAAMSGAEGRARPQLAVAAAAPLRLPARELPVPPYAFGVWLGAGRPDAADFSCADPEVAVHVAMEGLRCEHLAGPHHTLRLPFDPPSETVDGTASGPCPRCGRPATGWAPCLDCRLGYGSVQARLSALGVMAERHIPTDYLRAAKAQRRAVLAGLLDAAGTVTPSGQVEIVSTSSRLADDVFELIVSLGYRCGRRSAPAPGRSGSSSTVVELTFATADEVFRLEQKRLVHKERSRTLKDARRRSRYIVDVRTIASVPVRCVQVDSADHLYLAGRSMIPTHNSTLALDIARNASVKHSQTSVIFSLEMSKSEITMRLLSAEAGVKLAQMRSGRMQDSDWQKIVRRMSEISDAPLFIDDSPNMTMMEIRAKARRLKQRHDLKLIVLDYLQLMTSGKKVESRQQEVSEFSRQMKLLAKELEVPVIAISQLNRGPEQRTDKRPMLSDLRESGSLEQDADMVILVHRPDVWESDDPRAGEADLIVAKHRNGQTMTVTVAHQLHYSRFTDLALT